MKSLSLTVLMWLYFAHAWGQCDFYEDFSTTNNVWTQVGENVEIQNGRAVFINGAVDGEQRRIFTQIPTSIAAEDRWILDVDFTPTKLGIHQSSGNPFPGHIPIALTAGSNEAFNDCPDVPCLGRKRGTQDGIIVQYGATNPPTGDVFFMIHVKDSQKEYKSSKLVINQLNETLYLRLEKHSTTKVSLSVFKDPKMHREWPGSPIEMDMPTTVTNLNTLQVSNVTRGWVQRQMEGWVDNICLSIFPCESKGFFHLTQDTTICQGDTIKLEAIGGQSHQWSETHSAPSSNGVTKVVSPRKTDRFRVVAFDSVGCTDTASVHVRVVPKAIANFYLPDTIWTYQLPFQITNNSRGASLYHWNWTNNGESQDYSPKLNFTSEGRYDIELFAQGLHFCHDSLTKSTVYSIPDPLQIPNVITPNGDGINDRFQILGLTPKTRLTILNRWGQEVFYSEYYKNGWDGSNQNGKSLETGTYFYFLESFDGQLVKSGSVTVLK